MAKLTPKQKRFCEEYVIDSNATKAAERAGYSKKTARSQGQRLLTKVDISKQITKLQSELAKKKEITKDDLIDSLLEIKEHTR